MPSPGPSAAGSPPSEASVKQLLDVAQSRKLIDSVMGQMDTLMHQTIQQATQGKEVSSRCNGISINGKLRPPG